MKYRYVKPFLFLFLVTAALSFRHIPVSRFDATSGATVTTSLNGNSLYHRHPGTQLEQLKLEVEGEVEGAGEAVFKGIYPHEVVVKQTRMNTDSSVEFIGAYRYWGYSLFDILQPFVLKKKNAEVFKPAIDAYIVVTNDKGDSVTFSWSEVFHSANHHQIIIATGISPVKPYRKDVNYPIPESWKLVAGADLYAQRYLDSPTKICIKSFDRKDYPITRNMAPLFSPNPVININGNASVQIPLIEDRSRYQTFHSTFYGMGMGFHPIPKFEGIPLSEVMPKGFNLFDPHWIQKGLVCIASADGYRAVFSYSELFNRNDQTMPLLAVPDNPDEGGYYRIFLPTDFFADRSVKAVSEIYLFMP